MELLLLVLIIPMIPFYILSTMLSAGIFVVGIPFIILAAFGAFVRGFLSAFMSRNVFPTLMQWKERFTELRRTGSWYRDNRPRSPPEPALLNRRPRESKHHDTSPVLSNDPTVGSPHEHHNSTFGLNILETIPLFSFIKQYLNPPVNNPVSPRFQLLREMADCIPEHEIRAIRSPRQQFFEQVTENARISQYSPTPNQTFRSELSRQQTMYTAPTHQSLYELAQEASSIRSKSLFDELVLAADEDVDVDICPSESVSQIGSDFEAKRYDERENATDAAKLLAMFSATTSPTRKPIFTCIHCSCRKSKACSNCSLKIAI